ncbi:anti-sigma factor domain-containing protein [Pontibacillus salicampi]|uniref:Anti-sigma-W factor RsiW n=1 Tax=Pontibacillus salicampi TaxID=1449801 RepID=A0ABV6LPZ8_9BACI
MSSNRQCDLLLDYMNQTLTEEDKKQFEAHLQTCESCQEEWKEFQELTADLPYSVEPVEPNDGMKQRVLHHVLEQPVEAIRDTEDKHTEEAQPSHAEMEKKETTETQATLTDLAAKRSSKKWLQPLLAAALLLSVAGNAYFIATSGSDTEISLPEEGNVNEVLANIELAASEGYESNAQAAMIQQESNVSLVLQANNLKDLSGEEAYQVWLIDKQGEKFRAGTFAPNQQGEGGVIHPVTIDGDHEWDTIAVTLEPTPHSEQPKGNIVMASKL